MGHKIWLLGVEKVRGIETPTLDSRDINFELPMPNDGLKNVNNMPFVSQYCLMGHELDEGRVPEGMHAILEELGTIKQEK